MKFNTILILVMIVLLSTPVMASPLNENRKNDTQFVNVLYELNNTSIDLSFQLNPLEKNDAQLYYENQSFTITQEEIVLHFEMNRPPSENPHKPESPESRIPVLICLTLRV